MKIIQINGFRGILMAGFVLCCLFAGFVLFPGVVAQSLWNKYLVNLLGFPVLNMFQGVLVWGMVAISYYIISKGKLPLLFETPEKLNDAELNMIIKQARINADMKKMQQLVKKSDSFDKFPSADVKSGVTSPMGEKHEEDTNTTVENLK